MTDRIDALTVTLEENLREDDAQVLIDAISLIRGVVGVHKHVADHLTVTIAKDQLRRELWAKLREILA